MSALQSPRPMGPNEARFNAILDGEIERARQTGDTVPFRARVVAIRFPEHDEARDVSARELVKANAKVKRLELRVLSLTGGRTHELAEKDAKIERLERRVMTLKAELYLAQGRAGR